MYFNRV